MANIVITSTANSFTVVSNNYLSAIGSPCLTLSKSDIYCVYISKENTYVVVEVLNRKDFTIDTVGYISDNSRKTIKIDSIDGNSDLDTLQKIHDAFKTLKG